MSVGNGNPIVWFLFPLFLDGEQKEGGGTESLEENEERNSWKGGQTDRQVFTDLIA